MNLGIIYRVLNEGNFYTLMTTTFEGCGKSALFKIMEIKEIYDINIKR